MTSTHSAESPENEAKCGNASCGADCPHLELARLWRNYAPSERPGNKAFLDRAAEDFAGRAICHEGQALAQEIFVNWLAAYDKPYTTYFKPDSVSSRGKNATGRVLLSASRYLRIKKRFDKLGGEGGVGCPWKTLVDKSKAFVQVGTVDRGTTGSSGDAQSPEPDANENPFLSDSSEASSINSQNQTFFSSLWNSVTGYK